MKSKQEAEKFFKNYSSDINYSLIYEDENGFMYEAKIFSSPNSSLYKELLKGTYNLNNFFDIIHFDITSINKGVLRLVASIRKTVDIVPYGKVYKLFNFENEILRNLFDLGIDDFTGVTLTFNKFSRVYKGPDIFNKRGYIVGFNSYYDYSKDKQFTFKVKLWAERGEGKIIKMPNAELTFYKKKVYNAYSVKIDDNFTNSLNIL